MHATSGGLVHAGGLGTQEEGPDPGSTFNSQVPGAGSMQTNPSRDTNGTGLGGLPTSTGAQTDVGCLGARTGSRSARNGGPDTLEEMNGCECCYSDHSLHHILYDRTRFFWARDQCSHQTGRTRAPTWERAFLDFLTLSRAAFKPL